MKLFSLRTNPPKPVKASNCSLHGKEGNGHRSTSRRHRIYDGGYLVDAETGWLRSTLYDHFRWELRQYVSGCRSDSPYPDRTVQRGGPDPGCHVSPSYRQGF